MRLTPARFPACGGGGSEQSVVFCGEDASITSPGLKSSPPQSLPLHGPDGASDSRSKPFSVGRVSLKQTKAQLSTTVTARGFPTLKGKEMPFQKSRLRSAQAQTVTRPPGQERRLSRRLCQTTSALPRPNTGTVFRRKRRVLLWGCRASFPA